MKFLCFSDGLKNNLGFLKSPRRIKQVFHFLMVTVCLALFPSLLMAHEIRPAIATFAMQPNGDYSITISLNLEAILSGIGAEHEDTDDSPNAERYNNLRELPPNELRSAFQPFEKEFLEGVTLRFGDDIAESPKLGQLTIPEIGDLELARISEVILTGVVPYGAESFVWQWKEAFGSSVIRVLPQGEGDGVSFWLQNGDPSEPISIAGIDQRTRWEQFLDYIIIGFEHIVPKGLDHILFVIGIFLLSSHWKPLLTQVTAFTIAHSITLGLSIYGIVQLPSNIVEPLIAASIVYVGIENLFTQKLQKWRAAVVFAFGLLHGLGFASVLFEIGLPRDAFLEGLLAFNIGVELGQLAVIAVAFVVIGFWGRNREWYRPWVIVPGSLAVSVVGGWWFLERTVLAG
ncbi:MAG: HupE/UreJ family protein [bacterium]